MTSRERAERWFDAWVPLTRAGLAAEFDAVRAEARAEALEEAERKSEHIALNYPPFSDRRDVAFACRDAIRALKVKP